ncbi:aspartate/glutamate racemase family protein [Litoreibacter sp.]|nr:aspartate/glutamate racemase family protein [Litoreibacter sp.]
MADIKKIGLIGGVGWPATVLYYEGLCKAAAAHCSGGSPPMVIESLNMQDTLSQRGTADDSQSWQVYDAIFRDALIRLENAGCGIAAIASVTPHGRFSEYLTGVTIPVISILDATAAVAQNHAIASVIVLGTPVTMQGGWFEEALEDVGVTCSTRANAAESNEIQMLLDTHFYVGRGAEGRDALMAFCKRINPDPIHTSILLACTDFSAAFPECATGTVFSVDGMTFIDAGSAHVQSILDQAIAQD